MNPSTSHARTCRPRVHHAFWVACILWAVVAVLAPALPVSAQEQKPAIGLRGCEFFGWLLHDVIKVEPVAGVEQIGQYAPAETLLIIFGGLNCIDQLPPGMNLKRFVDMGGALLIATDRPDLRAALKVFKVEVPGLVPVVPDVTEVPTAGGVAYRLDYTEEIMQQIRQGVGWKGMPPRILAGANTFPGQRSLRVNESFWNRHRTELYLGFAECPLVKAHLPSAHPLFENCRLGIATNSPSFLRGGRGAAGDGSVSFPPIPLQDQTSWLWGIPWCKFEMDPAFAIWQESRPNGRSGRALFVGGHGVFMNGTMAQPTDNRIFASNALRWLSDGKRRHALFVHEDQVVRRFDIPLLPMPMPDVRMLEYAIREMEERNVFNQALQDAVTKPVLLRYIVGAVLVGLVIFGVRRLLKAGFHQEAGVPLVEARVALALTGQVPPLMLRQQVRARANDFLEPARAIALEALDAAGGRFGSAEALVVVGKTGDATRRLQKAVDTLWDLLYRRQDLTLSAAEFARIVELASELQRAVTQGTVRVARAPAAPGRGDE